MSNNPRCLFSSSLAVFAAADENSIFGILCDQYRGDALTTTREAWRSEITILKQVLAPYRSEEGKIVFEYDIPRLGKRIDAVLLLRGIIFCLEFKIGETRIPEADVDQVLDYALDLKNSHKFSEDRIIVPILIATNYHAASTEIPMSVYDDKVVNPLITGTAGLSRMITAVLDRFPNETPINSDWIVSPYAPTPTIIEAARTLYENHTVEEYQGQGYASEAVEAAVAWALQQPGVVRVDAETEPDNRASQRVLEKCGFLPTGTVGTEGPRYFRASDRNGERSI